MADLDDGGFSVVSRPQSNGAVDDGGFTVVSRPNAKDDGGFKIVSRPETDQPEEKPADKGPGFFDGITKGISSAAGLARKAITSGQPESLIPDRAPEFDYTNAPGMIEAGNVDPWNRKVLHNPDGSYSTADSISIGTDKGETVIPRVIDGKRLTDAQAIAHFKQTGENLGTFDSPESADKFATDLHNAQAAQYDEHGNPVGGDSMLELGRKFLTRIVPNFAQMAGGALQAGGENVAMPAIPISATEEEELRQGPMAQAAIHSAETPGTPANVGKAIYNAAAADLKANDPSFGDSVVKKYAFMAAESFTQMAPGLLASILTRSSVPALASIAAQTYGQQYGQARNESGRTPEQATGDAVFYSLAETIPEEFPMEVLMKPGGKFLPKLLKTMGSEGAQEMFTQILETGYDMGTINPKMTWGDAWQQVVDAGIVGAMVGGGMAAVEHPLEKYAEHRAAAAPAVKVVPGPAQGGPPELPVGKIDQARGAPVHINPGDVASPIDTGLIAEGKRLVAEATATKAANDVLAGLGLPQVGTRVTVDHGDGRVFGGTVADAFSSEVPELGAEGHGIRINLDGAGTFEAFADEIKRAGIRIAPEALAPVAGVDDQAPASAAPSAPASPLTNPQPLDETAAPPILPASETAPVPQGDGTQANPIVVQHPDHVDQAAAVATTTPTEGQKSAGNYQKGHLQLHGLNIAIENQRGSERTGVGPDGEPWSVTMPSHYGYLKRTEGADGEQVDVYVGPEPASKKVWVVDQLDAATGKYDESKVMLAFPSKGSALVAYRNAFSDGKGNDRIGGITELSIEQFKEQLRAGNFDKPVARSGQGQVQNAALSGVAEHQGSLQQPQQSTFPQLRGAGDQNVSPVGAGLSTVRGSAGRETEQSSLRGAGEKREGIPAGEREVGHAKGAGSQPAQEQAADIERQNAADGGVGGTGRVGPVNAALPARAGHERPGRDTDASARRTPESDVDRPFRTTPGAIAAEHAAEVSTIEAEGTKAAAPAAPAQPAVKAATWGEKNKLVTRDRAEELRARLRNKLKNQLSSGIDPEIMAIGAELSAFHIEAGARKFMDFANAIATDLGTTVQKLKPYLRSWYNGARDMMEDGGHDVAGMDDAEAVKAALANLDAAPATSSDVAAQAIREYLASGQSFSSITQARAVAAKALGVEKIEPGTEQAKAVEESIERGVMLAARDIARQGGAPQEVFDKLVDLYTRQPHLSTRSSTSIAQQAYSTPIPLGYLAAQRAGISASTKVYEPTAGNGALLMTAAPQNVIANELNEQRAAGLKDNLPGAEITSHDASAWSPPAKSMDVVIANPPFGVVKGDDGESQNFQVDSRYSTNEIDHAIALKALESMKDKGRAVLIVGSINKQATGDEARRQAYMSKAKKQFYLTLYGAYNVTDHFTVSGDLYSRQGAGWPVDVIVIEGRGKSARKVPAANLPRIFETWDSLKEAVNGRSDGSAQGVRDENAGGVAGTPEGGPSGSDATTGGRSGEREPGAGQLFPQGQQPGGFRGQPAAGEPGGTGLGEPAPGTGIVPPVSGRTEGSAGPAGRAGELTTDADGQPSQVPYKPASGAQSLDTLVPFNMQSAVQDALERIAARTGGVDAFVADRLGYEPAELSKYFGAEQVDAIAMAVDNMERGAGFILGDQTGVGKGRVVAAVLRYAMKTGRVPIFVTEKPNLYGDMYRDLTDTGIQKMLGRDVNILITNNSANIPLDEDGKVRVKTGSPADHDKVMIDAGRDTKSLAGHDVVFTTYAQMQTIQKKETVRRQFLRHIAAGAIVVFDESHNAGGAGDKPTAKDQPEGRAEFARVLAGLAHGVTYSSATYAKRPDVMDLYATTDMRLAVTDPKKLGESISKGGVPMQQVVATMLAKAGQYIRRERSFAGITYNTPVIPVSRETYNSFSSILSAVQRFSEDHVKPASGNISADIAEEGEGVGYDNATGAAGAKSTSFSAVMHNLISQMLLASKADPAAQRAIAALKSGKQKPVITVANTMGSFITDYTETHALSTGDSINITFNSLLRRYLERTRTLTIKKPWDKEPATKHYLTDEELGPAGVAAYNEAKALIDGTDLASLPVSPIDYIRSKIAQAGFTVGEITGRDKTIEYAANGTATLGSRGSKEKSVGGRRETISAFNSGKLDALILNQAGSTGLSIHASKTFKDKRKRRMIVAQAEGNIDTHMQMLGRINRTGQVVLPEYDQLVADVPAEKRPAAVLAKKMASLNANTTATRGSAVTAKDVPDFMNRYGDEVAARVMSDLPEIHDRLDEPLDATESGGLDPEDAMRKVTGRIPLLPIEEQESLYEILESEYAALLAQKDAAGENALEAKTLDLRAKVLDSRQIVAPVDSGNSPFAAAVNLETAEVKRTAKPYSAAHVLQAAAEAVGLEDVPEAVNHSAALSKIEAAGAPKMRADALAAEAAYKDYAAAVLAKTKTEEQEKVRGRLKQNHDDFMKIASRVAVGTPLKLMTDDGNLYGVVTSLKNTGTAKNPLALGQWKLTVALADAAKTITIPFSQMGVAQSGVNAVDQETQAGKIEIARADTLLGHPIIAMFDQMQGEIRERRQIITGNLLAGYDHANQKGSIINFTAENGEVRQGIMMPRDYSYAKELAKRPIVFRTPDQVEAFVMGKGFPAMTQLSVVTLKKGWGGNLIIDVAAAKAKGGQYYLNAGVLAAVGKDFVSTSNVMRAEVPGTKARTVIEALMKAGAAFQTDQNKGEAAQIVGNVSGTTAKPTNTGQDEEEHSVFEREREDIKTNVAPRTKELLKAGAGLHAVLAHIAAENPDENLRIVAARLNTIMEKQGTTLRAMPPGQRVNQNTGTFRSGFYRPFSDQIFIDPDMVFQNVDRVVLHEAIHAATVHAIYERTPAGREITKLYKAYMDMAGPGATFHTMENQYGFSNEREFIAEALTNPEFQGILSEIKQQGYPDNFWTRLINAIRRVLGLEKVDPLKRILELEPKMLDLTDTLTRANKEGGPYRRWIRQKGDGAGIDRELDVRAPAPPPPPGGYAGFSDPTSEARFQEAKKGIGNGPGWIADAKEAFNTLVEGFTRHYRALPNTRQFAEVHQELRALEAAPSAASGEVIRTLEKMVGDLTPEDMDLFTRKVVLDDLSWETQQDHDLPFGLKAADIPAELAKVDAALAAKPALLAKVRQRKLFAMTVANRMVEAGVLKAEQIKNPAYYRHQVLDYARAMVKSGADKQLKKPRWARREGSKKDINANLLEAEFDWLHKALVDIETAKTIKWIKDSPLNIRQDVVDAGRAHNDAIFNRMLADDMAQNGYVTGTGRQTSPMNERAMMFKRDIAVGLKDVRAAIDGGYLDPIPPEFDAAARAISAGTAGENVFPFLAWIADNNKDGARGAMQAFKAISGRKQWVKDLLGDRYANTNDIDGLLAKGFGKDGYVTWQPDEGNLLYTQKTLPEHVMDKNLAAFARASDADIAKMMGLQGQAEAKDFLAEFANTIRSAAGDALVVGGQKYQMVIPEELAATLNSLRTAPTGITASPVFTVPMKYWKQWTLVSPRRVLKYNLNNLTGDLDAVVAGSPRIVKRLPQAIKELYAVMKGAAPSDRYKQAVAMGVFDAGLTVQEIPDINSLSQFSNLVNKSDQSLARRFAINPVAGAWRALKDYTQFRENWLRYAAYLDYADRLERGETMKSIGYGASKPEIVDAVTDLQRRAAMLARDLVGDYGAVSAYGQDVRRSLIPFYSWMEINTKRYLRLSANAYSQGIGAGLSQSARIGGVAGVKAAVLGINTTAYLASRMFALYAMIQLFNYLFHDDDQQKLDPLEQAQLHIILGHIGGQVVSLRMQGAMSDFLAWIGLQDAVGVASEISKGRAGWSDVLATMAKAPVNKVVGSLTPLLSEPVTLLSGQKFWPDVFNPRQVRDSWHELFQTFGLENEYDALAQRPSRGYFRSWITAGAYAQDPGEQAYNRIVSLAHDWEARTKGTSGSSAFTSPRSEALYDWRRALRFGDDAAARAALTRMRELGVKPQDRARSLKAMHPLGNLSTGYDANGNVTGRNERRAFIRTLSPAEMTMLKEAETWYRQDFLGEARRAARPAAAE